MKKKMKIKILLILPLLLSTILMLGSLNLLFYAESDNVSDNTIDIRTSDLNYTNVTIISDEIQGALRDWNDNISRYAEIALDNLGNIHVVWMDDTDDGWGTDEEIMYCNYSTSTGWSFPKVISDGYNNIFWNDGWSISPDIAIDTSGNVHVVWVDATEGIWGGGDGIDEEIMYVSFSAATGWSNVTVISDGYNNNYWNDGRSLQPAIAIDNNNTIHVVWTDHTANLGVWGSDWEIMHVTYTTATGWSNATIVSDGYNNVYWNDGNSAHPRIAIDNTNRIHLVWEDTTDGVWGIDEEIMYTTYTTASGWSNATVISDGHSNIYWNEGSSEIPDIAIDSTNNIHVVWEDHSNNGWGNDQEILYTNFTSTSGWSLPKVVSDGYNNIYWNDDDSQRCSIAIEPTGAIYVAWQDETDGIWGMDLEIMCAFYVEGEGWSNATVISDGVSGIYWNYAPSREVSIIADLNNVHAVWQDSTSGIWGIDDEIMYTSIIIQFPPEPFTLSSNAGIPDDDGSYDLLWTESLRAKNYSVYQHSSYITDINISLTLVDESLTNTVLNLSEYESGAYYFIVEAFNDYGSKLSNNILVEVQIPSKGIPFGNFYLFLSFATILGLVIYVRKKTKL